MYFLVLWVIFTALILVVVFGGVILFRFLADRGIFILFPLHNRYFTVLRGGTYKMLVYTRDGEHYDEKTDTMEPGQRQKGFFEELTGAQFIGIWPICKVHEFHLNWDEMGKNANQAGYSVISHKGETIRSLFFEHPYALALRKAETAGNIPLNMDMLIVLRRKHPRRVSFGLGDPGKGLDTVFALASNAARLAIRELDLDEILGVAIDKERVGVKTPKEVSDKVIAAIMKLNEKADPAVVGVGTSGGLQSLPTITGYVIESVAIGGDIEPALPEGEASAVRLKKINTLKGDADIALAEREKKAEILRGQGRAGALEAEADIMAKNPEAARLRAWKAVEESNLVTLSGSGVNLFVETPGKKPDNKGSSSEPARPSDGGKHNKKK